MLVFWDDTYAACKLEACLHSASAHADLKKQSLWPMRCASERRALQEEKEEDAFEAGQIKYGGSTDQLASR